MVSLSRRTVTGLITTSGRQFEDWSADYRLLSRERFVPEKIFSVVRRGVIRVLGKGEPLVVAMDDTSSRKKGRTIPGAGWRRDPMGPPFRTQFLWGRRFLQISAVLPSECPDAPGRAIPIDLRHAPSPKRPSPKDPPEAWGAYRLASRAQSLARQGVSRLHALRDQMQRDGEQERPLWAVADGSYTNKTVLGNLPRGTTYIGRIRGDALLHEPPEPREEGARGRRPVYGSRLPTPEQVRQDPSIPWQTAPLFAAGKVHEMRYKTVGPVLWRNVGARLSLQLVVIAPLSYRPSLGSPLLYRKPAYLICTEPDLPPHDILKAYLARWDIEVNFRDEKQLLGLDEAQVRTEASARLAPALATASYALLLLAAARAFGTNGHPAALPPPKWRQHTPPPRASTNTLQNHLRFDLWAHAIHSPHFSPFVQIPRAAANPEKCLPDPFSALFYAHPAA